MNWAKRNWLVAHLVLGAITAGGCATAPAETEPRLAGTSDGMTESLLFSPGALASAPSIQDRSDWPSTSNPNPAPERIRYRETIFDRQGWFGRRDQFPIRQFRSTRIGTTRR